MVHKLGIQRVPYDIRNYAVMRVFGKMSWGYYAGLRFPKTGHPGGGIPPKIMCYVNSGVFNSCRVPSLLKS